ncbi:MAG: NUDIX hydrolase [Candidatus Aminicenantaceae bacterium]
MSNKIKYCLYCGSELKIKEIEGQKREYCSSCSWIYYKNPIPSVAALIENEKYEILLIKRAVEPGKGKWALPSGFVEIDETPEKACLRELKEETGLNGKIVRLIGIFPQKSRIYENVLIIGYKVEAKGKTIPGSDSLDVKYFSLNHLPQIPFSSHRKIIMRR